MAILLDEKKSLFTLCTKNTMYQMKADSFGVLLHTYYGRRTEAYDYSELLSLRDHGFSGNPPEAGTDRTYSLDVLPQEYSCYGCGDYRESALKLRCHRGAGATELRYVGYELAKGKYSIPGLPAVYGQEEDTADTLIVTMKDKARGVFVHLYYGVLEELDIITRAVRVENRGENPVYLERAMSMCLDQISGEYDLLTFYGRHVMERELSRMPVHHGVQSIGSLRGMSSHQYNPFMILADRSASETQGECYGFSFLYSGNFLGAVELDQMNQTRVLMGIHPEEFSFEVQPGGDFWTPETVMTYSDKGLERISHVLHKAYRNNLCRGQYKKARRPVLLNSWEGTYFDFTGDKLVEMAREAAGLGVELFVMDDGWFGSRSNDDRALGDWFVNEEKLGCTLKELSRRIHDLGLKFGIWVEPECVSENSSLYREHPDWAFALPGRAPSRSRYQLVLDFSREEVREHIFHQLCQVFDNAEIDYIKWDFNRSISDIYSGALPAERQGETAHRYVLGLYDFLEKLTGRYPHILIEGCCGGGGRFDAGMLYYTPQIWCSDDTDAIERIKIQYGSSFGYPVSAVGSHVSACPNHQTGRSVPLDTRATVAMAGTFGYELDPVRLSEKEREQVRVQIKKYKEYYDLIQDGVYYRLTDPYKDMDYSGWEFVSEDKSQALVSIVAARVHGNPAPVYIKLRGLKPEKYYQAEGKRYLGAALMNIGFMAPVASVEYESRDIHFTEEK